jgi:hypothetical protein
MIIKVCEQIMNNCFIIWGGGQIQVSAAVTKFIRCNLFSFKGRQKKDFHSCFAEQSNMAEEVLYIFYQITE